MNVKRFFALVEAELNAGVKDGWLQATAFDDQRACKQSKLHARVVGLLSWVLQQPLNLWVEDERRLGGGAQCDLVAYAGNGACEAVIEYESPNSYLPGPKSHVGKDIENYFKLRARLDPNVPAVAFEPPPRRWIVITSLPVGPIMTKGAFKYLKYLGDRAEQDAFLAGPYEYCYRKYESRFRERANDFSGGFEVPLPFILANISRTVSRAHRPSRLEVKWEKTW